MPSLTEPGKATAHLLHCGRLQPPAPNSPGRPNDRSGAGQLAVSAGPDVRQAELAHVITVNRLRRVTIWRPLLAGRAGSPRIRAATPQTAMPSSRPSALPVAATLKRRSR
jgi:hypothetical protein